MKKILATLAFCTAFATQAWAAGLIVVEDLGGASALPYYQGLDPQPSAAAPGPGDLGVRGSGAFPVRSARLSPGQVQGRPINAPGLQPLFLVGDDTLSRTWLKERGDELRGLQADAVSMSGAQTSAFQAAAGFPPSAGEGLFVGAAMTFLLLWSAWAMYSTWRGWATNNLDSATAGASAIRILVLLGITSFFLLS